MIYPKRFTVLFGIVATLAAIFYFRDWYVFYQCGAVEQCLLDSSYPQHYTKFAATVVITIIAFAIGKNSLNRRDGVLVKMAMVTAVLADICFKLLHNSRSLSEYSVEFSLLGICFFTVFQCIFIYRHTRTSDTDDKFPKIMLFPIALMAILMGMEYAGVFASGMIPTIAIYGGFLTCSLVAACRVPKIGYFPKKNAALIKWGYILFYLGDIFVGTSFATSDDHSTQEVIATVSNNFIWMFYVPALLMLVMSGHKRN